MFLGLYINKCWLGFKKVVLVYCSYNRVNNISFKIPYDNMAFKVHIIAALYLCDYSILYQTLDVSYKIM
jgi:hypothetical protein